MIHAGKRNVRRERTGPSRRARLEACGYGVENARIMEWERLELGKERGGRKNVNCLAR